MYEKAEKHVQNRYTFLNWKILTIFLSFDPDHSDCNDLPNSMQGNHQDLKGCAGAVWSDRVPSRPYCEGKSFTGEENKFPWWAKCCYWDSDENTCKHLYNPRKAISKNVRQY